MQKALLYALLTPHAELKEYQEKGQFTERLMLMEELKSYPFGAVWDYFCQEMQVPRGTAWLQHVQEYERNEMAHR